MLEDHCGRKWQPQRIGNEVFMALPLFYGHPPVSLKYALHHLSPEGIFLYLASLSYIVSLLGGVTSYFWNLNHIISLLSGVVSHHVSEIWTTSTSSRMIIDHIFEVGVASPCFYGHVRAMSNSWWHVLTSSKSWQHTLASSKYWRHSFPHLQGFVSISLHLQSLDRESLHLQRLVGISEILMSGYSAMHLSCLSNVASENWCCCSFIIKVNICATSMQVQVLMWSVVLASWQKWMLAVLL